MSAQKFAHTSAEERKKTFKIEQQDLYLKKGAANILKDFLKGENDHFEESDFINLDEL